MFEGIKDMGKLLKQAKEMKAKMKKVQDDLKKIRVTGASPDGKIQIVMSGELDVLEVKISPDLISSQYANALPGILMKAFNEAAKKAKDIASGQLAEISGGLNIPGLTD